MVRRHRARRVLKWTALSALLALTFVYVGTWSEGFWWHLPRGRLLHIGAERGAAAAIWSESSLDGVDRDLAWALSWALDLSEQSSHTWVTWVPNYRAAVNSAGRVWYRIVWVPLWLPWLLAAIATGWLWRGPRSKPGRCAACGYDLTGLGDGASCPECGHSATFGSG